MMKVNGVYGNIGENQVLVDPISGSACEGRND